MLKFLLEYWQICLIMVAFYCIFSRRKVRNISRIKGNNNHVVQTWEERYDNEL
jgi:membrane glycosyltransferase